MYYYQMGGPTDDSLDFDDQDSPDEGQSPDSGNDELSGRFNELQDHYSELSSRFDELYSRMNEEGNFNSLMSSYDNDQTLDEEDKTFADNASDGEPINWVNVNNNLASYKDHYNSVASRVPSSPASGTSTVGQQISKIESGGSYTATNPHSSATGKYQFLWSQWGDSIKKTTGVKSQQEFLHNPQAQEKFYSSYEKNYLMPQVAKLRQQIPTKMTDNQLAMLVHYRGAGGAAKYLKGQLPDKPESYNIPISDYIGMKQRGGMVANTRKAQNYGLNNPDYDQMYFPNEGFQTFRGLDNGEPVHVQDQRGKYRVLTGPNDTDTFYGNVFEKR
jgi:hypothetical protein